VLVENVSAILVRGLDVVAEFVWSEDGQTVGS